MRPVYITRLSKYLPNDPVTNDQMEQILGMVGGKPSKARAIILRNNGIKTRYYAYKNGQSTHSNAEMVKEAVQGLFDEKLPFSALQLLACGTTSPDQLLPSHAAMVHGELGHKPLELLSAAGACCAGVQAMKYAYFSIASGNIDTAVATGSEKLSTWMLAQKFKPEMDNMERLNENPFLGFEKDFIRWMLSDGAGAALLQSKPNEEGLSLKIEWIEATSFAHEIETCMYAGATKQEDASLLSWNDMDPTDWTNQSVFALKQDTKLLAAHIIKKGGIFLKELVEKHGLRTEDIDYFLPHMSSEIFRQKIKEEFQLLNIGISDDKWFTNLTKVGNVGTASPFLMLEELMYSGNLKKGQKILMMVPESARFSYVYVWLTVV